MVRLLLVLLVLQGDTSDTVSAALREVDRLLARGQLDEAYRRARLLVAAHPRSAEAHALAGDAAGTFGGRAGFPRMIGLLRECRKHYVAAVRLDSANVRGLEGLIAYLAQAPLLLGGDGNGALRLTNVLERFHLARGLVARALVLTRVRPSRVTGDSLVSSALERERSDVVLSRAADYFIATARPERALEMQIARLAIDSTSPAIWFDVARARLDVGDTTVALQDLTAAWQRTRPAGDSAWIAPERISWRLASVAVRRRRASDAIAWTDSTLLVSPGHASAKRTRDSLLAASRR